jgi:D-glycero-D-manno-heptose 1,7-bisphosphate phosphatase
MEPHLKPAVFIDRDGTIIRDVHHLADPARVELLPGAAEAIRLLRDGGFACVVVSNQSVIGRGLLNIDGLGAIHSEFCRQLAQHGAFLDGWYFCPAVPTSDDRAVIDNTDRKPAPGMLVRAAHDLGLHLAGSWMIGDMLSDILAGRNAGCRGSILVRTGHGRSCQSADAAADFVADDLLAAARWVLNHCEQGIGAERPSDVRPRETET